MSRKRFASLFTLAACAACLARPAAAQLGGQDLPDLSGLAGAIADSVKTPPSGPVPLKKRAPGTLYRSGLVVPAVHPGETARGIGRQLREKMEAKSGPNPAFQKMEDGMPKALTDFEGYMEKHGVAKRDMGVAMGVFIEVNWETATKQELSEAASANVVQVFSIALAPQLKPRYAATPAAQKEKQYESLLISPMIISQLTKALDKAGKTQEAASMRDAAGRLFTQLMGMAPSQMQISADGRNINIKPKAPAADAPPADAPPADTPAPDAPPAPATPPAGPAQ